MAGKTADFEVTVTDKDGKPVQGQNVVVTLGHDLLNSSKTYKVPEGMAVITTDNKGKATFVAKPNTDAEVKNDNTDYVGSYTYKVKVGDIESETKMLKVAAITYGADMTNSVKNLNGNGEYSAIVPGNNVNKDKYAAIRKTTNVNGKDVTYIGAQQVSGLNASDSHKVAFQTGVRLAMPAYTKDESAVQKNIQTLGWKSSRYHTYSTAEQDGEITHTAPVEYDLTNVDYATVHLNSLHLSKHTKAEFSVKYKVGTGKDPKVIKTVGEEDAQVKDGVSSFQIQEKDLNDAESITMKLVSEGQVDLDNNVGYDIKDIEYVYKSQEKGVSEITYEPLDVDVKWSIESGVYYDGEVQMITAGEKRAIEYHDNGSTTTDIKIVDAMLDAIKELDPDVSEDDYYNMTYSVPAFPETGNAIIRCYDKNGTVKKFFTCATIKREKTDERNVNILYWDTTANSKKNLFYEIADKEINTENVGEIVKDDSKEGIVVVDSTDSGITHLKAEISSSNPEIDKELDVTKKNVYTSIMWNPVLTTVSSNNSVGIAFAGQTAEIVAQLIDEQGNPVSKGQQPISWSYKPNDKITVVEEQTTTDTQGQAKLRLSAAEAVELIGLTASTKTGYGVKIEGSTKGADIYWVDLGLVYNSSALGKFADRDADTSDKAGTDSGKASAVVGETWEYASQVVGFSTNASTKKFQEGELKGKTVELVKNIVPAVDKQQALKGDVTVNDSPKGSVTVTSTESIAEGEGAILFRINRNTDVNNASVIINGTEYKSIGTGSISANETLTLNYEFAKSGSEMEFLTGNGNKSAERRFVDDSQVIYLKLQDSYGNPVTKLGNNERIKISIKGNYTGIVTNAGIVVNGATPSAVNGYWNTIATGSALLKDEQAVNTDKNGRATIVYYGDLSRVRDNSTLEVYPNGDGILAVELKNVSGPALQKENIVVTANYQEIKDGKIKEKVAPVSQTYSFVDAEFLPVFTFDTKPDNNGENRMRYDRNAHTITLAFTNDVLKSSVRPEQFTVSGGGVQCPVESVTVDKNKVILQLDGRTNSLDNTQYFEVKIKNDLVIKKSVGYLFNSVDGQEIATKVTTPTTASITIPVNSRESIAKRYQSQAYNAVSDAAVWSDPSYVATGATIATPAAITEATMLLTLAGVDLPTAMLEDETLVYLAAIANQLGNPGTGITGPITDASAHNDFLKAARKGIDNAKAEKAAINKAIGNLEFSKDGVCKLYNTLNEENATTGSTGAALRIDGILIADNVVSGAAASSNTTPAAVTGSTITIGGGNASTGSGTGTAKKDLVATSAAILNAGDNDVPMKVEPLAENNFVGAPKKLKLRVVVTGTYYVRVYELALKTELRTIDSKNVYVVTGYDNVERNEVIVKDKYSDIGVDLRENLDGVDYSDTAFSNDNDEGIGVAPSLN